MTRDRIAAEEQRCAKEWYRIQQNMARTRLKPCHRSKWHRFRYRHRVPSCSYLTLRSQSHNMFMRLERLWDALEMIDKHNVPPLLALLASE